MTEEKMDITPSSGNVFKDMNFPEAQEAQAKSRLAMMIYVIIKTQGLSQKEAAKIMNLSTN